MSQAKSHRVLGPIAPGYETILSAAALDFITDLAVRFTPRVKALLDRRQQIQAQLDSGMKLDFLPDTADIRRSDWTVAPLPDDLQDRRVEITGPVDRKMVINALNSEARCFMADFEDATSPTWQNLIEGQINLRDAIAGTISHEDPKTGRHYSLADSTATLLVRPRGWHLWEKHVQVDSEYVPAGLFDFGLFLFHNAKALLAKGTGPYFYLPKLESHLEARLWNDVFHHAQEVLGIAPGTIKATVLIETLPAAFEMDEILYELRDHSAGLNCGRWDYIFSFIKKLHMDRDHILPERHHVTMTQPFMRAYTLLLIKTCHRRNAHAMGGMAAQIPIKDDPAANAIAMEKVRADKLREVEDGHDGTWVAHPGLIPIARAVFDEHMPGPNQIDRKREDVEVKADDLLRMPDDATRSEQGLRDDIRVAVQYIEAWLGGRGAVPLYNLMEDAATAEIARTQIWQWLHLHVSVDGKPLTEERFLEIMAEEMHQIRREVGDERFSSGHFMQARDIFKHLCLSEKLEDFLTVTAYEYLLKNEARHH